MELEEPQVQELLILPQHSEVVLEQAMEQQLSKVAALAPEQLAQLELAELQELVALLEQAAHLGTEVLITPRTEALVTTDLLNLFLIICK